MQGRFNRFFNNPQLLISLCALLLICLSTVSRAHEITPSILNLEVSTEDSAKLSLDVNLEALLIGVGSEHEDTDQSPLATQYNRLRAMTSEQLEQEAQRFTEELPRQLIFLDAQDNPVDLELRLETITVYDNPDLDVARETQIGFTSTYNDPLDALSISWPQAYGNLIFRLTVDGNLKAGLWVPAGETSDLITLQSTEQQSQSLVDYVVIGFEHILPLGLDHILFVVGIYLLSQAWRALLWQVSAFTLAHTITLALATLGLVSVSPSIVEPLIALSIVYVAVENLFRHSISKGRILLVFGFGLLHGLGFAGVLSEIGLDQSAFIPSLIAFNVGVELGQLTVIGLMFALFGFWLGKSQYWERWVRIPLSILIALVGAFWFVERII